MTDKIHNAAVRAAIVLISQPDIAPTDHAVEDAIEQAIRAEFADVDLSELLPCFCSIYYPNAIPPHAVGCPVSYHPAVALAIEAARAEGYAEGMEPPMIFAKRSLHDF